MGDAAKLASVSAMCTLQIGQRMLVAWISVETPPSTTRRSRSSGLLLRLAMEPSAWRRTATDFESASSRSGR